MTIRAVVKIMGLWSGRWKSDSDVSIHSDWLDSIPQSVTVLLKITKQIRSDTTRGSAINAYTTHVREF